MSAQLKNNSNFYALSPGLNQNKSQKQPPNSSEFKRPYEQSKLSNNESQPFENILSDPSYQHNQLGQPGQLGHQSINETFPQPILSPKLMQQVPPSPLKQSSPLKSGKKSAMLPGQANLVETNRQKLLEDDIKNLIEIFKGLDDEKHEAGSEHKGVDNENGVDAREVLEFLKSSRPQIDQEYQELLDDFLMNISKNMSHRHKINEKDLGFVLDNVHLKESEKHLNPKEMTYLFSQIDKRKRGTFNIEDLYIMAKDSFNEGKGSKEEFRKYLAWISPNEEINVDEFYNIMSSDKLMKSDYY